MFTELYMMAVRQYQQAATKAFEHSKHDAALKLSVKAEKALKNLYIQQFGEYELPSTNHSRDIKPDITDWLQREGNVVAVDNGSENLQWPQFRCVHVLLFSPLFSK